ncbi:MAG: hypothetical protein HQM16_07695 [Deltaproteobacteria bacterium]|nr:hypothetical protein [Deltaproteobacteria bacterium]
MVDYVKKVGPSPYRVDEAKDSLDEDRKRQRGDDDDAEGDKDNFDKSIDQKHLKDLYGKSDLWQRDVEVKVEDVDRIKFLGLSLKTNPALLKMRIFLFDGSVMSTAFMAVSRALAMRLKNYNSSAYLDINTLTDKPTLLVALPKKEEIVDDEITSFTKGHREKTLSETFRMLISKKTLAQKLGITDENTKQVNSEILWVYLTVIIVVMVILLGGLYLLL